jgi:hypothetical protein
VNIAGLLTALRQALVAPTKRQNEAHARFLHGLATASLVGSVTLIYASETVSLGRVLGLLALGVICFLGGMLFLRSE